MSDDPLGENIAKMMQDGYHLRTDYNQWIEARDPERGLILVGGVGGGGYRSVWVRDERHEHYLGYDQAPVVDYAKHPDGIAKGPPPGATRRAQ